MVSRMRLRQLWAVLLTAALLSGASSTCHAASASRSVGSVSMKHGLNRFPQVRPQRFQYTTFDEQQLTLYAWAGKRIAFLTPTAKLDPAVMGRLLTVFDDVYDYYHATTGREPEPGKTFRGRDTIAVVDCTCGAGCGYLGATGIELLKSTFATL
jgi:hypothetical protein